MKNCVCNQSFLGNANHIWDWCLLNPTWPDNKSWFMEPLLTKPYRGKWTSVWFIGFLASQERQGGHVLVVLFLFYIKGDLFIHSHEDRLPRFHNCLMTLWILNLMSCLKRKGGHSTCVHSAFLTRKSILLDSLNSEVQFAKVIFNRPYYPFFAW